MTQAFEVKMGVPLPQKCSGNGAKKSAFRVALESLPISGMIEAEDTLSNRNLVSLVSRLCGRTLTVRTMADNKLGIWRTA